MATNAQYATTAKPKTGGAIWRAPIGTALPTDAKTALNEAFVSMGYISEDGLTNDYSMESSDTKAWGGDTINSSLTSQTDTWKCAFVESLNTEVLKTVFGDENVSGDLTSGITVRANVVERDDHCYVVDMVERGGVLKRVVIPCGKLSAIGEILGLMHFRITCFLGVFRGAGGIDYGCIDNRAALHHVAGFYHNSVYCVEEQLV